MSLVTDLKYLRRYVIRRWSTGPKLPVTPLRNRAECDAMYERMKDEIEARRAVERQIHAGYQNEDLSGYCHVCRIRVRFADPQSALNRLDKHGLPFWREMLVCPRCGLSNRTRAAVTIFEQECQPEFLDQIYLTEQTTGMYHWFAATYRNVTGSEFLAGSDSARRDSVSNLRHEDLTALTFPDNSLNHILSLEVMEHVPDYKTAFRECLRCLCPGGSLLFTLPFIASNQDTIVRASLNPDGTIEHHLSPEYHGDPMRPEGCLCFYHFGWELLDELRAMGYSDAAGYLYWSRELGNLGQFQLVFVARK